MDSTSSAVMSAWQRTYALTSGTEPSMSDSATGDRAVADAQAAWLRWHQPIIVDQFALGERPWYLLFERARVETLAGLHLPGMLLNLSEHEKLAPGPALPGFLYRCARRLLVGEVLSDIDICLQTPVLPMPRLSRWFRRWRAPLPAHQLEMIFLPSLQSCRPYLHDAILFAETLHPLIRLLSMIAPDSADFAGRGSDQAILGGPLHEKPAEKAVTDLRGGACTELEVGVMPPYHVFSREWDECLEARQLAAQSGRAAPEQIEPQQRAEVRRMAGRLRRRLLATQLRHWSDEQELGVLERRRLAALVAVGSRLVFRQERESLVPQACVTLLLDQSGSMRGLPMMLTLQAVDLAVQALEACGIRTEVLGFGTRFGADNPLRLRWRAAGCPPGPGRLNALRHSVYKPARLPWRRCRHLLMYQPDTEGENIDGEALEWAASRLLRQPEPRKVLVVFSDGNPYDEATVSANGRSYLENHLHNTVTRIEAGAVHLAAIGVGQGVTRYYRNALVLQHAEQVGEVLFEHLGGLLTRPGLP